MAEGFSTPCRQSRKSEPGPRGADALPRAVAPRHSGWEFPLSREEKKQRVMYLFEAELADAEQNNATNLEALQTLLEKRKSDSPQKRSHSSPRKLPAGCGESDSGSAMQPVVRASSQSRFAFLACGVIGAIGALVLSRVFYNPSASSPQIPSASVDQWVMTTVASPNITDRVLGMREVGHHRLKLSNCAEAEWWFASALHLMSLGGNMSDAYRNHIVGERGFALVCAHQFDEGAKLLEMHLARTGWKGQPHVLNALGYARFHLQEYRKATEIFDLAIKADNLNPVPWNNFAAAKIMIGELPVADYALNHAAQALQRFPVGHGQDNNHYRQLLEFNVHVLVERADEAAKKETLRMPWIDLWNGYTSL